MQARAPSPSAVHHPPLDPCPLQLPRSSKPSPSAIALPSPSPSLSQIHFPSSSISPSPSLWRFVALPLPAPHLRLHLLQAHQLLIGLGHLAPYIPPKFPYPGVPPEICKPMSLFPTIDRRDYNASLFCSLY